MDTVAVLWVGMFSRCLILLKGNSALQDVFNDDNLRRRLHKRVCAPLLLYFLLIYLPLPCPQCKLAHWIFRFGWPTSLSPLSFVCFFFLFLDFLPLFYSLLWAVGAQYQTIAKQLVTLNGTGSTCKNYCRLRLHSSSSTSVRTLPDPAISPATAAT